MQLELNNYGSCYKILYTFYIKCTRFAQHLNNRVYGFNDLDIRLVKVTNGSFQKCCYIKAHELKKPCDT